VDVNVSMETSWHSYVYFIRGEQRGRLYVAYSTITYFFFNLNDIEITKERPINFLGQVT